MTETHKRQRYDHKADIDKDAEYGKDAEHGKDAAYAKHPELAHPNRKRY